MPDGRLMVRSMNRSVSAMFGIGLQRAVAVFGAILVFAHTAAAQPVDYPPPDSREEIGDWVLECYEAPVDQCQIYQRILINQGTGVAMVATFAWDATAEGIRAQIALPLGITLAKGAIISGDDGGVFQAGISRCTQQGCLVEGVISETMVTSLESSETANITVVDSNGNDFAIPIMLDGFTEALARIRPGADAAEGDGSSPASGDN